MGFTFTRWESWCECFLLFLRLVTENEVLLEDMQQLGVGAESLNAAYVSRVLCPQSAAQRRCTTPPLRVGLSSTPNTNPQQPDTGDERSRQACKRGVPSRPVCLSAQRSSRPSMPNAADRLGEDQTKRYPFPQPRRHPAGE